MCVYIYIYIYIDTCTQPVRFAIQHKLTQQLIKQQLTKINKKFFKNEKVPPLQDLCLKKHDG